MENNTTKPFSQDYVVKTTVKHMIKSIEISIKKTFERLPEFSNNQEKSSEIFKTLTVLQGMKKMINNMNGVK